MRLFSLCSILIVLSTLASNAYAGYSRETNLCLTNARSTPVTLKIYGIVNDDWEGNGRPDHVFRGKTIQPGAIFCQRLEVNSYASRTPQFKIAVGDSKARMVYYYSQKCDDTGATDGSYSGYSPCQPRWNVDKNNSGLFKTIGLRQNPNKATLLIGKSCEGQWCTSFTIK